jgi:hypothetical protein
MDYFLSNYRQERLVEELIRLRGELRGGEPHHTIADRRPAERVLLKTFP